MKCRGNPGGGVIKLDCFASLAMTGVMSNTFKLLGFMIIKHKLAEALKQAVTQAQQEGVLVVTTLPELIVERPQNTEHGDYASSLPLKLARTADIAPQAIAEKILEFLPPLPEVAKIVVVAQASLILNSAPIG